jgi:uncharacterized membrane protein
MKHKSHINPMIWMISISTLVLFICSSVRHELFHSTAFDLGIFDQAIYLISQGKEPLLRSKDFTFLVIMLLGFIIYWQYHTKFTLASIGCLLCSH